MILSSFMTEVQHVQYLLFYILHSNIYLHKNPNVNPDKPLPISCNQTQTVYIIYQEINGQ